MHSGHMVFQHWGRRGRIRKPGSWNWASGLQRPLFTRESFVSPLSARLSSSWEQGCTPQLKVMVEVNGTGGYQAPRACTLCYSVSPSRRLLWADIQRMRNSTSPYEMNDMRGFISEERHDHIRSCRRPLSRLKRLSYLLYQAQQRLPAQHDVN
jgi:hypothetical protein